MIRLATIAGVALALAGTGCSGPLPHPYAPHPCDRPDMTGCLVNKVTLTGNEVVSTGDISDKIATAESSHTLGGALENIPILSLWDRLTVDYETMDPFVLQRDLSRVERFYRVKGYYDAHARAARVVKISKEKVRVEIAVEEGEPVLIASVAPEWAATPPNDATIALVKHFLKANKIGTPFDEDSFENTKRKLRRFLTDNGYAYSEVKAHADVDLITHEAKLVYTVDTGPVCKFGEISLEGYGDLPADKLRQAIHIQPGQTYSTDKMESAQNAVGDLRVAGSVTADPQLSKEEPRATVIPVIFHITPTSLKTVKLGLGGEVGSRVEVHGVASWDNRNFLGGLRHLFIEGKPGIVINPLTFSTLFSKPVTPLEPLFELRVHADLEQPGFIEARTKGLLSVATNLYQLQPLDTLGYLELATKAGLARDFWGRRVSAAFSLNVAFDQPIQMTDYSTIDTVGGYHRVIIPYAQATGVIDLRYGPDGKHDAINTHYGFYLSNDTQLAVGDSRDFRIKPEVRGYVPLGRKVTLALRATAGFLFAFGGDLANTPTAPCPGGIDPAAACVELNRAGVTPVARSRYIQVMQLRGFNSGGPTSNRGYAYNGVGPQEAIPGISLLQSNGLLTPIATGGSALWEASAEVRFPIYDKLGGVIFLDGSDVRWGWASMLAPFAPHLSAGFGLRYLTPVGPFRADFGVRIPYLQVLGQGKCVAQDPSTQPPPAGTCYIGLPYGQASTTFTLPLSISLAIGEAY